MLMWEREREREREYYRIYIYIYIIKRFNWTDIPWMCPSTSPKCAFLSIVSLEEFISINWNSKFYFLLFFFFFLLVFCFFSPIAFVFEFECTFGLHWKGKQTCICVFCVGPVYCSRASTFFSAKITLKLDPTTLFTHLKIILLQFFQFSVFSNKRYLTDPKRVKSFCFWIWPN